MASGDLIVKVADKDTLDRTYANTNAILAAVGEDVRIKGVKRYGMKINKNDSNPATRCTYLFDAVGMTPAAMNYSAGRFDFGDWGNVFFVKNNYPAMVKYDGTEDYKLDPNDHTKKADGKTASDVSNTAYGGNAMSVFDGSGDKGKIWLSQFEVGNYEYMIISNVQYDESYNDDAYVREDGSHADKLYFPMFGGSYDGTRIRSLAGQALMRYMDDMVILGKSKKKLHKIHAAIETYLNDNLDLEIKGDWQVFRFEYPVFDKSGNPVLNKDGKQVTKGRMLDFMGFQFHHDRTTIRKSNIEAARRKANHISKQDKISWYNASVMLSYMGLFKHTDTYNYYIDYIKPKINVKKLKRIVSKHSRKENEHDRLEKGDRNTAGQAGGGRQDIVAVNGLPA